MIAVTVGMVRSNSDRHGGIRRHHSLFAEKFSERMRVCCVELRKGQWLTCRTKRRQFFYACLQFRLDGVLRQVGIRINDSLRLTLSRYICSIRITKSVRTRMFTREEQTLIDRFAGILKVEDTGPALEEGITTTTEWIRTPTCDDRINWSGDIGTEHDT